ncbi:MAG: putative hydro-lyase [Pseudomonadota bacterium]
MSFEKLREVPVGQVRSAVRRGDYAHHTAGLAPGCLQANLVVLPKAQSAEFEQFCTLNPRPCPIVGQTLAGDPHFRTLGDDVDVRRDLPSYNIYRNGELVEQVSDLGAHWNDDLIAFALGCSFTFENALTRAGISLWHIANNTTVPMFRTNLPLAEVGPFKGHMVVSMRALAAKDVDQATEISARYPWAHGGPVHVGDPAAIGIADITKPDWGDPAPVERGQVPMFWACGVTPQAVVIDAKLPFVITHTPGHMLITDVPEDSDVRAAAAAQSSQFI